METNHSKRTISNPNGYPLAMANTINSYNQISSNYSSFNRGYDKIIRDRGDSMEGRISQGDLVGIRKINGFKDFFFSGLMYLVVIGEQEIIKYVHKIKGDKNNVLLVSENKRYEDEIFPIKSIKELWEVKVVIPISKIQIF